MKLCSATASLETSADNEGHSYDGLASPSCLKIEKTSFCPHQLICRCEGHLGRGETLGKELTPTSVLSFVCCSSWEALNSHTQYRNAPSAETLEGNTCKQTSVC